ncbi:hypothetical protein PHLCEN_2v2252 [Hermanssonia centrifuga]|uniref:Uncharacterized protein n=1 Tax=Hermanssonia centrifuga TaxID=98765 RepID=A0A2R6RPQ4_9APHY|nr:hypothetical protein PHLCEN_2v2252 [Hermanssonia centrifuga]
MDLTDLSSNTTECRWTEGRGEGLGVWSEERLVGNVEGEDVEKPSSGWWSVLE